VTAGNDGAQCRVFVGSGGTQGQGAAQQGQRSQVIQEAATVGHGSRGSKRHAAGGCLQDGAGIFAEPVTDRGLSGGPSRC